MRISYWSSDVCSSDLKELEFPTRAGKWAFDAEARAQLIRSLFGIGDDTEIDFGPIRTYGLLRLPPRNVMIIADDTCPRPQQIGRAPCRERGGREVSISVVDVSLKKK